MGSGMSADVIAVEMLADCYIHLSDVFPPAPPKEEPKGPEIRD